MNFTHLWPMGLYMTEIEFHDHWNANSSTTIFQKFKIIFKRGWEIKIRTSRLLVQCTRKLLTMKKIQQ